VRPPRARGAATPPLLLGTTAIRGDSESTHEIRIFTDDEGALITTQEGKPYLKGVRNAVE